MPQQDIQFWRLKHKGMFSNSFRNYKGSKEISFEALPFLFSILNYSSILLFWKLLKDDHDGALKFLPKQLFECSFSIFSWPVYRFLSFFLPGRGLKFFISCALLGMQGSQKGSNFSFVVVSWPMRFLNWLILLIR